MHYKCPLDNPILTRSSASFRDNHIDEHIDTHWQAVSQSDDGRPGAARNCFDRRYYLAAVLLVQTLGLMGVASVPAPVLPSACSRLLFAGRNWNQSMSVKVSSHSKTRIMKVTCDRCKQIVEGLRGVGFTAGFYDMTKWAEYRRENEQYICNWCMFADPRYVERYGSCF